MSNKINIIAGLFKAFNYESITITNSVKSLTPTVYGELAKKVIIIVENATLRYRLDGGNPTIDEGMSLNPFDTLTIIGSDNIKNFKAIRKTSTNSKIFVTYEK